MPRADCSSNTIRDSISRVAPSLRGPRASRPPCGTRGVRARLRAAGQPSRAGLVLEEVGVRHVERHSRLRSSDELAALHAPLDDGPRHADVRHPADAVACELAADDEAQPPAQRGDDERARLLLRARPHVTAAPFTPPVQRGHGHARVASLVRATRELSRRKSSCRDMPPTPSSIEMGGVSTVKVGADGKESALLVRRGAGRWICLLATVLVLGIGGAWYTHDSRLKGKAEMSRLTRLLRDTGARVDTLRRVSDRLEDSEESSETKEKIAKELKIGNEVHKAQVEHARAQANVMKRGSEPNVLHAAAADKAAQAVPAEMQRAMLGQFVTKARFLMWATTPDREKTWRESPLFGKPPADEVEEQLDSLEEVRGRHPAG